MYLKFSVEGLVFGVDRLGCKVLGLDINAKVQCVCTLNAISWCHIQAGYTSVGLAVEQKHEATVEVLLEAIVAAGMDIDARYESRREQGQTLLMRASALGLTSTVAKLLALGADIAAKDAVLDNVCFSLFQFFFPSSSFFSLLPVFFFLFPPLVCFICMYVFVYVYMIVYMFVLLYMYVCIDIYVR